MSPELIRKPVHYDRHRRRCGSADSAATTARTGALLAGIGAIAVATGMR
jgi:hypothetical protein